jgi:hypothetical protein
LKQTRIKHASIYQLDGLTRKLGTEAYLLTTSSLLAVVVVVLSAAVLALVVCFTQLRMY